MGVEKTDGAGRKQLAGERNLGEMRKRNMWG
jgi:hypothetical protein